jgi:hypothetical protein
MKRKLAATAIAVVVSIPLIPWMVSLTEYLTGGNAAVVVVPSPGWKLKEERGTITGAVRDESGAIIPQVEVQESAVSPQTEDVKQSTTLQNKLVNDLPLFVNGTVRTPFDLASLTPDAKNLGGDGFSIGGGQSAAYGTTLDGVSANTSRALQKSWVASNSPSVDAIEQFTVDSGDKIVNSPPYVGISISDKPVNRGWYALDLPQSERTGGVRVQLEFVSRDDDKGQYRLIQADEGSGPNVAWVYFDQPGSIAISASIVGSLPKVRNTGFAELVSKSREIGFAKVELTVFLLCEMLPLLAWILMVCLIEVITDWAIGKLPRIIKSRARHQIEMMLTFAKWAGIVCYVVWTGKDILACIVPSK